jgi:uncharacterized damage-inducible protein DinB
MPMNAPLMGDERGGLVAFLQHQREAVLNAVYGLREDQARVAPTSSSLTLGGLVKHLAYGETNYVDLIEGKPLADQADAYAQYMATFVLGGDETLSGAVSMYRDAAQRTDAILSACADFSRDVPLPAAPWYPERCTVRWIALHLIEETARHAGHADIIREALDGGLSGPLMAAAEGWPADGWVKPWQPA